MSVGNFNETKKILAGNNLRAKKKFGQNLRMNVTLHLPIGKNKMPHRF